MNRFRSLLAAQSVAAGIVGVLTTACSAEPSAEAEAVTATTVTVSTTATPAATSVFVPTTVSSTLVAPTTIRVPTTVTVTSTMTETVTDPPNAPDAPDVPATPAPESEVGAPRGLVQQPATQGRFANCTEAKAAGAAPVYRGAPGYSERLDRDGDGVGCES